VRLLVLLFAALCGAGLLVGTGVGASPVRAAPAATVASVQDGDTLTLRDGRRIRLVQIDSPELGSGECYSRAARTALLALVPIGSRVTLQADPELDQIDRYGRLLRYVERGAVNVNLELVRRGAATPYFYGGKRGRYASLLLKAAVSAKAAKRGLWGACPHTRLDPLRPATTGQSGPPANPAPSHRLTAGNCAPSYPDVCIPPPPPDLDCKDVPYKAFRVVYNVPDPDPHHFDGDHDGIGCER
jgi:micrococcal nuclease